MKTLTTKLLRKVVILNGSPNADGHTAAALKLVEAPLKATGIETEWVQLGKKPIRGCIGCMGCKRSGKNRCIFADDLCNTLIDKLIAADGIVVGTPTYYAGVNGALKALLDRVFFAGAAAGAQLFKGRVGAAVATQLRSGGTDAIDQINKYFQFSVMPVASGNYWNILFDPESPTGRDPMGEDCLKELGESIARLVKVVMQ